MISKFEQLDNLFEEIDNHLNERVDFFIIGGAVMVYNSLKSVTKDIDIIVDSKKEFEQSENALKKIGFKAIIPTLEYKKFDISQIFVKGDFRIDLFQKTVCKGFQLSKGMKERALKVRKFKNLTINICSTTDVFMLKTFTEREGDIADCISLVESAIDWDSMLQEIMSQIKTSGNKVWITWIGERLDILEERRITIPIMKDVNKLRDKYFDDYEKSLLKKEK